MSSWMNDAAVQNHNGAGFNHLNDSNTGGNMLDPSAFMANSPSFDPNQFQNQQLQQRMQNGGMRNGSPAFNNPVYQTNPVIPSKRPRPREDSLGTSPRQPPGMLPNSRSQTPQQGPYPGFQPNNVPPQHAPQQTQYSHLQNGSSNASPSPIMANQLRPGGVPQRVSTASPHPFSPSQSDHGSRVDTPQSGSFNQNPSYTPGFNQNFTPPPGRTSAPPQSAMSTPQMPSHMPQNPMYNQQSQQQLQQPPQKNALEQTRAMYQMRLQQQQQQLQLQQGNMLSAQGQNMVPSVNPLSQGQMMQTPNGQFSAMRPQQSAISQGQTTNTFLKSLMGFMSSKNLPLETNPFVGDRNINIAVLYMAVSKYGGFRHVTATNAWPTVSQALHIHPMRSPNAPQQLKSLYEKNLFPFEDYLQKQRAAAMKGGNPAAPQMSPTKQMTPPGAMQSPHYMQQQQQFAQQHLQQQHAQTTPVKQMTPMHHPQQPMMNGFSTPQPPSTQPHHPLGPQGHVRNSLSRSVEATPLQNGSAYPLPSPASGTKVSNSLSLASPHAGMGPKLDDDTKVDEDEYLKQNLPEEYPPKTKARDPAVYGGIDMRSLYELGEELLSLKPDFPTLAEMGTIDVHALTMSLQSGLHAEVRLALDTLVVLSVEYERLPLELRQCDDLVESLIDCAEVQVELLAENAAEVSDVMLINSYEDVVRSCYVDKDALRDIPAFGTLEYILDRAVDKLICIMSILRNLSFHEQNQPLLSEEFVIKFICVVIRYLGTRNMLLRTNQNTLDFMKDGIVLLSNLAHEIKLPGREQALCLLHFLIAFAPCPPPNCSGSDKITFSPYDPTIHYYLYPAVDSLAKLLARDEPNRTHYKTIFASDVASSPPFDLLTRTFALSISAIPDQQREIKRGNFLPLVEARKPMLMQGLLAAEILSNLAPGYDSGVARAWLTSEDGFAKNLSTLILSLCNDPPQTPQHRTTAVPKSVEEEAMLHIVLDGIAVLRTLAEKSRDPDDPTSMIPIPGMPATERIIKLLERKQPRLRVALRQLCAFISFCS
jgi:SWI/SNF chromatin-remodeling complex subunit SWI1